MSRRLAVHDGLTPEPPLTRMAHPIGVGLGILLAALLFAGVVYWWWRIPGGGPGEDIAAAQCQAGYQRSRTAADSAMIDSQRPIISRGQATAALTCRELRLAGELHR